MPSLIGPGYNGALSWLGNYVHHIHVFVVIRQINKNHLLVRRMERRSQVLCSMRAPLEVGLISRGGWHAMLWCKSRWLINRDFSSIQTSDPSIYSESHEKICQELKLSS